VADDAPDPLKGSPWWAKAAERIGVPGVIALALIYVLYLQLGAIQKTLADQASWSHEMAQVWTRHLDADDAVSREQDRAWAKTQTCIMNATTAPARAACFQR
jgi:hypothetical protein